MVQNKFILTDNSSYENKGCEAIVRGTVEILDKAFGNDNKYIVETRYNTENSYIQQRYNEYDMRIEHVRATISEGRFIKKSLTQRFVDRLSKKYKIYGLFEDIKHKKYRHLNILDDINDSRACLCIGGDNYSLDYGLPKLFTDTDDVILDHKKPCVIWGASIGPFSKDKKFEKFIQKHMKRVTAIFAREDVTIDYLNRLGIKDNVHRISDPAFMMKPVKPADFDYMNDFEESVGINLSPLMAKYWADNDIKKWTSFCIELVEKVSQKTQRPIYLVPHVVHSSYNNDYKFMENIKNGIKKQKEKVFLLRPDYTAAETKYIISQLKSFMGARTHSTIAAFSTCIPTVSLAYSIKATGINKEVFGDLSYCVSEKNLRNTDYIADLFNSTIENNASIRQVMIKNVKKIKERAQLAGTILKKIV